MLMEVMTAMIMTSYNYHGDGGGADANGGYDGDDYDFI